LAGERPAPDQRLPVSREAACPFIEGWRKIWEISREFIWPFYYAISLPAWAPRFPAASCSTAPSDLFLKLF